MLDGRASGLTHADIADALEISRRAFRLEIAKCLEERRDEAAGAPPRRQICRK